MARHFLILPLLFLPFLFCTLIPEDAAAAARYGKGFSKFDDVDDMLGKWAKPGQRRPNVPDAVPSSRPSSAASSTAYRPASAAPTRRSSIYSGGQQPSPASSFRPDSASTYKSAGARSSRPSTARSYGSAGGASRTSGGSVQTWALDDVPSVGGSLPTPGRGSAFPGVSGAPVRPQSAVPGRRGSQFGGAGVEAGRRRAPDRVLTKGEYNARHGADLDHYRAQVGAADTRVKNSQANVDRIMQQIGDANKRGDTAGSARLQKRLQTAEDKLAENVRKRAEFDDVPTQRWGSEGFDRAGWFTNPASAAPAAAATKGSSGSAALASMNPAGTRKAASAPASPRRLESLGSDAAARAARAGDDTSAAVATATRDGATAGAGKSSRRSRPSSAPAGRRKAKERAMKSDDAFVHQRVEEAADRGFNKGLQTLVGKSKAKQYGPKFDEAYKITDPKKRAKYYQAELPPELQKAARQMDDDAAEFMTVAGVGSSTTGASSGFTSRLRSAVCTAGKACANAADATKDKAKNLAKEHDAIMNPKGTAVGVKREGRRGSTAAAPARRGSTAPARGGSTAAATTAAPAPVASAGGAKFVNAGQIHRDLFAFASQGKRSPLTPYEVTAALTGKASPRQFQVTHRKVLALSDGGMSREAKKDLEKLVRQMDEIAGEAKVASDAAKAARAKTLADGMRKELKRRQSTAAGARRSSVTGGSKPVRATQ